MQAPKTQRGVDDVNRKKAEEAQGFLQAADISQATVTFSKPRRQEGKSFTDVRH